MPEGSIFTSATNLRNSSGFTSSASKGIDPIFTAGPLGSRTDPLARGAGTEAPLEFPGVGTLVAAAAAVANSTSMEVGGGGREPTFFDFGIETGTAVVLTLPSTSVGTPFGMADTLAALRPERVGAMLGVALSGPSSFLGTRLRFFFPASLAAGIATFSIVFLHNLCYGEDTFSVGEAERRGGGCEPVVLPQEMHYFSNLAGFQTSSSKGTHDKYGIMGKRTKTIQTKKESSKGELHTFVSGETAG